MSVITALFRPETLLVLLWGSQFVRMAWPGMGTDHAGAVLAALYLLRALPLLRRPTLLLCGTLTLAAALLVFLYGGPASVLTGFQAAPLFAGFFGTIVLLRATGDRLRQIRQARELFERLEPDHRLGGFLVGSHLLAAVLGPGAYAVTAPIIGESKVAEEHLAAMRACHRGGGLAGLWSPFWIAMALSSQYVPGVPLWHIMALGLPMAACALTAAHVIYAKEPGLTLLWRALQSLHPIVPPVALCVLSVAVVSGVTVLSGLEALIVSVPVLCALAFLGRRGRDLAATLADTYRGTAHVGNEVAILTLSLALGGVIRHMFAQTGVTAWIGALDLPAMAVIALVIGVTAVAALAGVHQVVTVSLLLTVFTELPVRVADLVLIESTLAAWSCSAMIGVSSIMVATATTLFRVPLSQVILGPSLRFTVLFAAGATLVLTGVNALLM